MAKVIRAKTAKNPISLKTFYNRKNKILIYRQTGGLGDILMHRMIFEDLKKIDTNMKICFACPAKLMDAVIDHPYLDEICSVENINMDNYVTYNTSHACSRYECGKAPLSDKHRSDIWAEHCGITLKNHDMHIILSEEEKDYGHRIIEKVRNRSGKSIVFCPISAMASKNLLPHQIIETISGLLDMDLFPFGLHPVPIEELTKLNIPTIYGQNIRHWMSVIWAADYVLSVDTAAFHFAGGIGKPLTGIFTWADGKVYGKYFDFTLVQKHRDDFNWDCGPCYLWSNCIKTCEGLKPCLTELTGQMILNGVEKMLKTNIS